MGLRAVFKDLKKNVQSMDETMDHTDQEIEHFSRVLDATEDSLTLFDNCIGHTEKAIQGINNMTTHGDKLIDRLHALLDVLDKKEMILTGFYGAIIVTFLISILVIENLIQALIENGRLNHDRVLSFFGSMFDYMFLSIICLVLRVFQLMLFIIVAHCSLESVKKIVLNKVEIDSSDTNGTVSTVEPSMVNEAPSTSVYPNNSISQIGDPSSNNISEISNEIVTESPISTSLVNNAPSSVFTSRSDLSSTANDNPRLSTDSSSEHSPNNSEMASKSIEQALQIASSITQSAMEANSQHSSNAL